MGTHEFAFLFSKYSFGQKNTQNVEISTKLNIRIFSGET